MPLIPVYAFSFDRLQGDTANAALAQCDSLEGPTAGITCFEQTGPAMAQQRTTLFRVEREHPQCRRSLRGPRPIAHHVERAGCAAVCRVWRCRRGPGPCAESMPHSSSVSQFSDHVPGMTLRCSRGRVDLEQLGEPKSRQRPPDGAFWGRDQTKRDIRLSRHAGGPCQDIHAGGVDACTSANEEPPVTTA